MEGSEIVEAEKVIVLPPSLPLTVGIAISGKSKSKYVVNWALEKFIHEEKLVFKLLHVRPRITTIPTPMGNSIPISQVREDVAAAYKQEIVWQTNQMLLPFKKSCAWRKVQADILDIEADDVANALAEEVAKCSIKKLVIGAASHGLFTRKLKGNNLSSIISACIPNSCTVYVVSKGKLLSIRPSDTETNGSIRDDTSVTSSSTNTNSTLSLQTDDVSVSSCSHFHSPSLPMQRFQALSTINRGLLHTRTNSVETNHSRCQSLDIDVLAFSGLHTGTNSIDTKLSRFQSLEMEEGKKKASSCPSISEIDHTLNESSSWKSLPTDFQSWMSDQASTSDALTVTDFSSDSQINVNFELEKLRIELRHVQGMYAMAQGEAIDASRKLNDLNKRRLEEAMKLKEISDKEEKAKELARQETERSEAAIWEAEYMWDSVQREASKRKEAEIKAIHEAREREKLETALAGPVQQYQKFTWEDIESATSSFSENLKIGMGAYGTVYKCSLHHTTAAVKVLHSKENHNSKQFQQELEVLSKIRHPHLLILLGACPDHGCLVYEYMENGSLEDRLQRVKNTPSIPWFDRYRIAWEVASALVFLHNNRPEPIIHRDLKPANILLDHNFVSKIGDVGLSTMLDSDASYAATMFKDTGPVGTLCYIDPEYQRTGLISPKSDVYAFGMVILQLLTAKPAIALTHIMETAIEDNNLKDILDWSAGNWPFEVTKELALLGLSCAELRRKDRPDLKDQVLPALERLKEVADRARIIINGDQCTPPYHFICPILKDVMMEPCVAADGYTYDRKAIEKWMEENDKSPMTNLPLSNKNVLPNYSLLSAILEWKSNNQ